MFDFEYRLDTELSAISRQTPLQSLDWHRVTRRGIHLSIKREDMLDCAIGGNKLYKLHGHLNQRRANGDSRPVASFGGAWSNHIYALAAACEKLQIPAHGIIRGEHPEILNAMLTDARAMGMRLVFVSREDFRRRNDPGYLRELESRLGLCHWIPEGGGGLTGAHGCRAITEGILALSPQPVDVICHAVGTGTTLAGIASALQRGMTALGVAVLKGAQALDREIRSIVADLGGCAGQWGVDHRFHCGGYARAPDYLLEFIREFETETGILLDPVYTAKLMWAITCLAESGYWAAGTHVVAVHSGGLQGRRGYDLDTGQTNERQNS